MSWSWLDDLLNDFWVRSALERHSAVDLEDLSECSVDDGCTGDDIEEELADLHVDIEDERSQGDDELESGEEDDEEHELERDEYCNSPSSVAVRRAFLASVTDGRSIGPTAREVWDLDQISVWLSEAMDTVLAAGDIESGAKALWREWARIEQHFPVEQRRQIINMLDDRMKFNEFPCLRELVD